MAVPIKRHSIAEFDQFVLLPGNADRSFEFIGGEIIEMVSNNYASEIAALIIYFIQAFLRGSGTVKDLKNQHWHGNVRELRNHLEKKLIYSRLGESVQTEPESPDFKQTEEINILPLEGYIRQHVLNALKRNNNNKTKAAEALGIGLSTLKRKLKKWGIELPNP